MLYQDEKLRILHKFAAFARTKAADEEYRYFDPNVCACGQFLKNEGAWTENWPYTVHNYGDAPIAHINYLASLAARPSGGQWTLHKHGIGKWGDLLKLIEEQIDGDKEGDVKAN